MLALLAEFNPPFGEQFLVIQVFRSKFEQLRQLLLPDRAMNVDLPTKIKMGPQGFFNKSD
jgi:hypothetical protein